MKKLINLLLLFLLTTVALPASAYDVVLRCDDGTVQCKDGSTWSLGATNHSITQGAINEFSASNKNLMVRGSSNNSTFNRVIANGGSVSMSGRGSTTIPNSYNIDLSKKSNPILVEVYANSSTATYTYDLNFSWDDVSEHIVSVTSTDGKNYNRENLPESCKFKYNETFTITTSKQPTVATLSGKVTTVNSTNSGSTYTFTFTPFPGTGSNTPTFSMTIPGDNVEYNFSATSDEDSNILGYKIDDGAQTAGSSFKFKAEQQVTIYTAYEPLSYYGMSNLSFTNGSFNGQQCKQTTFTAPPSDVSLDMTFKGTFTTNVDASQLILAYTATDWKGETRDIKSSSPMVTPFYKGDTFTMYSKYQPSSSEPSRTWTASTYNGVACFVTSFTPTADGTFTLTYNDGEFTVQILDDEAEIPGLLAEYFAGYQVVHDDGSVDDLYHKYNSDPTQTFSTYGSCITTFGAGDTYKMYFKAVPESVVLDGSELEYTEEIINGETLIVYTFIPTDDGRLSITIGTPTAPGPIVEETFTVKLKVDRANVINAQVRTNSGNTDIVLDRANEYITIECPESGYIYCTIIDPGMYTYQTFLNEDENVDFLDYDPPTTYPVTIRKTRATSDTEMITNDGDKFSITTNSKANLQWYELTVNIADDASNVRVEVGTSKDAKSPANREITNLQKGNNTIRYNETETYLVVSSQGLRSLYNVESTVGTVTKTETWPAEFWLPIGADNNNSTVTVTANEPIEEGDKRFTLNIDHPELVTSVRRFVGGSMQSYTDYENLSTTNSIDFTVGDTFRIFINGDYADELDYVKQNDTALEAWNGLYDFTPADGDVITVYFGDLPVAQTFTVVTDRPDLVSNVSNYTRDSRNWPITEEFTDVEFYPGDEFRISLGSVEPRYIRFNDEDVAYNGTANVYYFNPTADGTLKIVFSKEPTRIPSFIINVDDASHLDVLCENDDDETELFSEWSDGENIVPVGSGSLLLYVNDEATLVTQDGETLEMQKRGSRVKWYELENVTNNTVVNIKFAVDPKMTVYTDDPTKITDSNLPALTMGANQFNIEGNGYSFKADNAVAVKLNGTALEANEGTYSFTAADGDVLKVFFAYEPACTGDLYTVKATFTNQGTENFVTEMWVDNTFLNNIAPFVSGNVLVDKDSEVGFRYRNHDYIINGITVNGTAKSAPFQGTVYFGVTKNSEVVFDVTLPEVRNFTINVTEGREDDVVVSHILPGTPEVLALKQSVEVEEGQEAQTVVVKSFTVNSLYPYITIAKANDNPIIVNVTDADNNSYALNSNIEITDGMVLNIAVADVVFDKTFTVNVKTDTPSNKGDNLTTASGRTIALSEGDNTIEYNADYDGLFMLAFSPITKDDIVCINGTEISTDPERLDMFYTFTPQQGDMVTVKHLMLYNSKMLVIVEGDYKNDKIAIKDGRNFALDYNVDRNILVFNEMYEEYFELTFDNATDNDYVYLNGTKQTANDGKYALKVKDSDILRIYHHAESDVVAEPATHELSIDASSAGVFGAGLDVKDNLRIYVEGMKWIDMSGDNVTSMELHNTLIYIAPLMDKDGNIYHFNIVLEHKSSAQPAPAPAHAPARAGEVADGSIKRPFNTDGTHEVTYNGAYVKLDDDMKISIPAGGGIMTGVEEIENATVCGDLYNMQGIMIKANATAADLKHLPAGIYIVGGRKIVVK